MQSPFLCQGSTRFEPTCPYYVSPTQPSWVKVVTLVSPNPKSVKFKNDDSDTAMMSTNILIIQKVTTMRKYQSGVFHSLQICTTNMFQLHSADLIDSYGALSKSETTRQNDLFPTNRKGKNGETTSSNPSQIYQIIFLSSHIAELL